MSKINYDNELYAVETIEGDFLINPELIKEYLRLGIKKDRNEGRTHNWYFWDYGKYSIKTFDKKTEMDFLENYYRKIDFSIKSIEPISPFIANSLGIKSGEIIKYKSIHEGNIINGDPVALSFGYTNENDFVVIKVIHKNK